MSLPKHRRVLARALAPLIAMSLLAVAYAKMPAAQTMAATAKAFVASLGPVQREKATFKVEDEERFNWNYVPASRKGLPLREMTPEQRQLAMALLAVGLSQQGFIKATTVMSVEEVLKALEGGSGPRRDPDGYFFSVFGEPSDNGVWGYRIDGHHLSQNFTIVRGKVVGAPSFFGVNPAEVPASSSRKGLRTLPREEDLGRDLIQALAADQRKTAIVAAEAPGDILTEHSRVAALKGQPSGIQVSALNPSQREKLHALLDEYCDNVTEEIAAARHAQVQKAGNDLWFAWAGGLERGQKHYYRIQSATFLIEYDNTQNNANHIHSVWRDFRGDFGRDLLAEHYQASHVSPAPPQRGN
jgi:hypothetical protein